MKATITCAAALAVMGAVWNHRAFAGEKDINPVVVTVTATGGYAYGSLGSARNSSDGTEDIGCTFTPGSASCTATNSSGLTRSCTAPGLGLAGLSDDAYIYFSWSNGSTNCTDFIMLNWSANEPKKLP
jgi:hypothetical protein